MSFSNIRDKYGNVDPHRNQRVRWIYNRQEGRITGSVGHYLTVRFDDEQDQRRPHHCHVYDLDYQTDDGNWLSGNTLKDEHNAAWDRWNERLNGRLPVV